MSNPSINRWGLNTFWHNFWYNDFNYAHSHNLDMAVSKLIHTFLFSGLTLSYNIFANDYWYSKKYEHLRIKGYHRWITRKPNKFGEILKFSLRKEADSVFLMKLWILKYGDWFIVNQYWFQPFKQKKRFFIKKNPSHLDSMTIINEASKNDIRRFKTLLTFDYLNKIFSKEYYSF